MRTTLIVLLALLLGACAGGPQRTAPGDGHLLHVVAFWLKPDTPAAERDAMVAYYSREVAVVPGLELAFIGRPAGTPRDVVDNSYDLLAVMRFCDAAAAAGWQDHPVHRALLARFAPHFLRVQVYDARE